MSNDKFPPLPEPTPKNNRFFIHIEYDPETSKIYHQDNCPDMVMFKGMCWQAADAKSARNAELQKQPPPIVIPRIS